MERAISDSLTKLYFFGMDYDMIDVGIIADEG
jgi:hypothetical protein